MQLNYTQKIKAMKTEMYKKIEKHGQDLNNLFNTQFDNIELCKKLRRLEAKASNLTLHECNTGENKEAELKQILTKVQKILKTEDMELHKAIFINGDPRGYALKIDDNYIREHNVELHRDWGGYGILAPDFS